MFHGVLECLQVSYVNLRKDPDGKYLFVKMRMTELRKCIIINHSRCESPSTRPSFRVPQHLQTRSIALTTHCCSFLSVHVVLCASMNYIQRTASCQIVLLNCYCLLLCLCIVHL